MFKIGDVVRVLPGKGHVSSSGFVLKQGVEYTVSHVSTAKDTVRVTGSTEHWWDMSRFTLVSEGSINIPAAPSAKPHVHADTIKAWADGATIQFKNVFGEWATIVTVPKWQVNVEYRIKPEPKPDVWCEFIDGRVTSQMPLAIAYLINGETGKLMDVRMKEKDSGNV